MSDWPRVGNPLDDWWEWYEEYLHAKPTKQIMIATPNGPQTNKFKELMEHGKAKLVQEGDQHSTPPLSE